MSTPEPHFNIERLLEKVGLSAQSISRLKLGRGVAGNMATITVTTVLACMIVAVTIPWWPAKVGAILLMAGLGFHGSVRQERFARERPDAALLEGAELILWQKQQLKLQAKHIPTPPKESPKEAFQIQPEQARLEESKISEESEETS